MRSDIAIVPVVTVRWKVLYGVKIKNIMARSAVISICGSATIGNRCAPQYDGAIRSLACELKRQAQITVYSQNLLTEGILNLI